MKIFSILAALLVTLALSLVTGCDDNGSIQKPTPVKAPIEGIFQVEMTQGLDPFPSDMDPVVLEPGFEFTLDIAAIDKTKSGLDTGPVTYSFMKDGKVFTDVIVTTGGKETAYTIGDPSHLWPVAADFEVIGKFKIAGQTYIARRHFTLVHEPTPVIPTEPELTVSLDITSGMIIGEKAVEITIRNDGPDVAPIKVLLDEGENPGYMTAHASVPPMIEWHFISETKEIGIGYTCYDSVTLTKFGVISSLSDTDLMTRGVDIGPLATGEIAVINCTFFPDPGGKGLTKK